MEQESGVTIERFESEDEFAFFAGGHADIVSTGSYETPVLESENNVPTVTIGKYNKAKDIVVVAADKPYETFGDLPSWVQGRSRVLQRFYDRVAGAGERPGWSDPRGEPRRPADGDHRLRLGPRAGRQGRPVCRRYLDLQRDPVPHEWAR